MTCLCRRSGRGWCARRQMRRRPLGAAASLIPRADQLSLSWSGLSGNGFNLSCYSLRECGRHFQHLGQSAKRRLANCASGVVQACAKGWIDQTSTDLANGADGLLRTV